MTVHGVPQAIAAFERRKIAAKVATPVAVRSGAEIVARVQRALAPKDTGALASAIVVQTEGDTAHVGSTVPYDRFVQRGTRYMDPQPYGSEAAESVETAVVAAMAAVYKIAMR